MKTINKLLCLLAMTVFVTVVATAQDSRAYDFATDKKGDLRKDANGNAIDFSAVTSLITANTANQNTQVYNLPFNVVLLGKVYKHFLIGTSGYLALGNNDNTAEQFLFPATNGNSFKLGNNNYRFQGVIAPFWDIQTAASLKYTVTGTAPNRALVVEWVTYIPSAATPVAGSESNYQVRIYENGGVIEYVYGKMVVPATNTTTPVTATIGIARNSALADYNFLVVTDLDSFDTARTLTAYTTSLDNLYNKADSGVIAPLTYDNDSNARRFVFTPDVIYGPSNMMAINITYDQAVLYWDDNSNNEVRFEIEKKDKYGNFNYFDSTTQNINFYLAEGFYPGEEHLFRVRTFNQGQYSAYSNICTVAIPPAQLIEAVASGAWSNPATWSTNSVPSRYDSVVVSKGYEVIMDDAAANAYHLVIDSGALIYENTSATRKLNVHGNIWVSEDGKISVHAAPTNVNTSMVLAVRGDIYNNGVIDLYKKNGTKEEGVILTFFGRKVSAFITSATATTNISSLSIERTNIADSVYFSPTTATVRGYNTDVLSNGGFVETNNWVGTLVIGGNYKLENRLFTALNPVIGDNAGVVFANDSLKVVGQNSNIAFNGTFKVQKGVLNFGTNNSNYFSGSFDLIIEGGSMNLAGRLYSPSATSFIQTGGKLRLAVVGNNTNEPTMGLTTAVIKMLGGEIVLVNPGIVTSRLDYYVQGVGASEYTGTWVKLTDAATTVTAANPEFLVRGVFPNLLTDSSATSTKTVKVRLTAFANVIGDFIHTANDTLNLSAYLYLADSVINNGYIYSGNVSGALVFNGKNQTLTGTGYANLARLDILQTDTSSTLVIPAPNMIRTMLLNLTTGNVINAKYLRLGDSINTINIEISRVSGSYFYGGTLDTFPELWRGNAAYNISYINLGKTYKAGFEIPADRNITNLTINSDSAVAITNGSVNITQILTLTKGVFVVDAPNKIRVANPAAAAIAGGSATAYIRGAVARRLDKKLTAGAYTFPIGNQAYSPLSLNTLVTDSSFSELTVSFRKEPLTYSIGKGITTVDTAFGHWVVVADSNAKGISSFGVNVNYKIADGFVRVASGKTNSLSTAPAFDSAGTRVSPVSVVLAASKMGFDTSANTVLFIAPAEYSGDTIYNNIYKVGRGYDFENLTAVSRKLASSYIAGNPKFLITSTYDDVNEEYPVFFTQMRYAGNGGKVLIRLDSNAFGIVTGSKTKTTNASYGMIAMYGADSIEFDGAGYDILGNPTNTREWTFRTETNAANASVFMLQQDAHNNAFSNLNIVANASGTQGGIFISNTFTGGQGNDGAIIKNNSFVIGADRVATYGVVSVGLSAAATNDNVQILNNEFSNFTAAHIAVSTNSGPNWKISGNHFFQNDTRALTSAVRAIDVVANATAHGYEISYNYIGGTQKFASGAMWSYGGTTALSLMNITIGNNTPTIIKGNVIRLYTQSQTSSFIVRVISLNAGKFIFSGNKIGGNLSSYNDALVLNNSNVTSILYIPSTVTASAEITDNEFSYIRHSGVVSTAKAFRVIDYQAAAPAYITRNALHDIQGFSSRITGAQDAAFMGVYLANNFSNNIIENNEMYSLLNNSSTATGFITCIGTNGGNGDIRNNKLYKVSHQTTSASAGTLMGIHVNAGTWNVYNNQILFANEAFANTPVSLQGIRYYSTSAVAGKIHNNTIVLGGQTRSTNSYGLVHGSTSARVEMYNNIVINKNNMTGGATFRAVGIHAAPSSVFSSDFNVVYTPIESNAFYNVSNATAYSPQAWNTLTGLEKNTIFNTIPTFRDTLVANLLLTLDTINWKLNAAGRATTFGKDYEGENRHNNQPDIGADEFGAPMFATPVFVGGNDTLCAGNTRTLIAQNPNTGGKIYWFNKPYGGDTLQIGDTLVTGTVTANTAFYAQVSDSLVRSYRIEVPVNVIPVLTPNVANLPIDSVCKGTSWTLIADSTSGAVINWYDSLNAVTPFHTGRSYTTPVLTSDTTFYISTVSNGCVSAKVPFEVLVSDTTVGVPAISSQTVCEGSNVTWTTNGPDIIRWYNSETETLPMVEDTIFDAGNLYNDTTYWYEVFNGRCLGNRNTISVTVNPIPTAPVIDSQFVVCYNGSINLAPVVSGTATWYADAVSTTPLNTGALIFNNMVADTTLFVDNSQAGCTSTRVKTTIKVQTPASVNFVSAASPVCFNTNSQIVLSKNGNGTIKWFDQYGATTTIATGDTLNTTALVADKTYYYELFDGLCTTVRDSVQIAVIPFAIKPVINPVDSVCYGLTDTLVATAAGAVINWYENKTSAPVYSGNDFVLPAVTGNKKYFAKAVYAGCESDFETVSVNVRALPQPPLVDSVSPVCRGNAAILKAVTPATAEWFNSPFATTPSFTGNTYTTANLNVNTTFYVQSYNGYCRSEKRPVAVTLRNAPAAPVIKTVNPFCWGDNVTIEAGSNSIVRWYKEAADTVPFVSDSTLFVGKLFKDTTYYIESYDGFCTSSKVTYNVGVIRYMDGFSVSIPDSANIKTQVTLSATGNFDNLYGWNFGSGASLSSATGTGPHNLEWSTKGLKNVRLTITKRVGAVTCDTVITKTVKVYNLSELLSTQTVDNASLLSVYPNPASSVLNIIATEGTTIAHITLADVTGKTVYTETVDTSRKSFDVQGFAKGVYLLQIRLNNGQTVMQKVIID